MMIKNIIKVKNLAYFLVYSTMFLIGLNFYLGKFNSGRDYNYDFFRKLKEINYFKQDKDPYLNATKLEIHPNNYFSLPLNHDNQNYLSKGVFSLNEYNFRKNPYNKLNSERRNCIFFTGSSAGFGIGASKNEKTIPSQLHKILGDDFLIYNFALPSWNSRQEFVSLINGLNNRNKLNCKTINSISFTGNADMNNAKFSSKSKLFSNKKGKYFLRNSPEQYYALEKKLDNIKKIDSSIKYNFRILLNQIYSNLFLNIEKFITNILQGISNDSEIAQNLELDDEIKKYMNTNAKLFFNNQILMNNVITDLGGKHFVFIQPDLKSPKSQGEYWNYANKTFSSLIKQNKCLKIRDLRDSLIHKQKKYEVNGKMIPMSLKDSIENGLFKLEDINEHYFYDNSHLTDNGSKLISSIIYEDFIKEGSLNKKCELLP